MAGRAQKSIGPRLAFWDTSALVRLCVRESATPRAIALYESYETVIWWATPVEIASALARLARMKRLSSEDWAKARALAADLAQEWRVIQPSNSLRARAMELVGRYDLASGDALQLSAALDWCEGAPLGKVFLTSDQKLREAAVLTGFEGSLM